MIRDYIEIEVDDKLYEVEFTFSRGGYGNGIDEAPYGPEINSMVIIGDQGDLCTLWNVEAAAEEEIYDYINENY